MQPQGLTEPARQLGHLAELRRCHADLSILSIEEFALENERGLVEGWHQVEGFDVAVASQDEIRAVAWRGARQMFEEDRQARTLLVRRIFKAASNGSSAPVLVGSGSSSRARERRGRSTASRSTAGQRGDPERPRPTSLRLSEGRA